MSTLIPDPYADIDWSLPCSEIAKSVGKSLHAVYQERYRRGINIASVRCIPHHQQPDDHKLVRLKHGGSFKCSNEDYDNLKTSSWYLHRGRAWTRKGGRLWVAHQFLFGQQMDHINRDPLDNRRENLRPATQQQNCFNRGKQKQATAASRYKGVFFKKAPYSLRKPWIASIQKNRRGMHLGYFATQDEAARAYDAAAIREFGEFATLNFPVDKIE